MKKLTEERKVKVLAWIESGRASYELYKSKKLSTFTDEGRKAIRGYWDAQEGIGAELGCSMTKINGLLEGKLSLDDLYNADGSVRKATDVR